MDSSKILVSTIDESISFNNNTWVFLSFLVLLRGGFFNILLMESRPSLLLGKVSALVW